MKHFDALAREVLAQVEIKRDQVFDYREHTEACDDNPDSICVCPVDVYGLLDDLVDTVRHLVWLHQLEDARQAAS